MSSDQRMTEAAGADPDAPVDELASRVEAILISAGKAVPPGKLAEALAPSAAPDGAARADTPGIGGHEGDSGPDDASATGGAETEGSGAGQAGGGLAGRIEKAVAALNERYAATGRSFRIERVAGGYRLMTLPEYASVVGAFHKSRSPARLSRPALETLAIIAYRQPITRAKVEAIRGVACGEVLRTLMERRLVTINGRAEELGRPMLYGTTKRFLDAFGLSSLKDLPREGEVSGEHG